jgi:hypothetical protein
LHFLTSGQEVELHDLIDPHPVFLQVPSADRGHHVTERQLDLGPSVTTCDDDAAPSPLAQDRVVGIGDPHRHPFERLLRLPAGNLDPDRTHEEVPRRRAVEIVLVIEVIHGSPPELVGELCGFW